MQKSLESRVVDIERYVKLIAGQYARCNDLIKDLHSQSRAQPAPPTLTNNPTGALLVHTQDHISYALLFEESMGVQMQMIQELREQCECSRSWYEHPVIQD